MAFLRTEGNVEALPSCSNTVLHCRAEDLSRAPKNTTWIVDENLVRFSLARIIASLMRQPNPYQNLPLFTKPHPHHSHQQVTTDPVFKGSASRSARSANMSHQRVPPQATLHCSAKDRLEARHHLRKEKLMHQLQPIVQEGNSDCSHLFICWGRKDQCHILAIKIPNSADDVAIWQLIRQAWYRHRGKWRKYVPVLDVQQIHVVKVRIGWSFSTVELQVCTVVTKADCDCRATTFTKPNFSE